MRCLSAIVVLVVTAACSSRVPKPIEFLTRSGCAQTDLMRGRIEQAIKKLVLSNAYTVVDLDTLAAADVRRGYPTPTVLVGGGDLFGMQTPTPPFPDPT